MRKKKIGGQYILIITYLLITIYTLIYAGLSCFDFITNRVVLALFVQVMSYVMTALPYVGVGLILAYADKSKHAVLYGILFLFLGIVLPILPAQIVVLGDHILMRIFLHTHVVFAVLGGYFVIKKDFGSKLGK